MPLTTPLRLTDTARHVDLTIHDGAQPQVSLSYDDAKTGVQLSAQVKLDPANRDARNALDELAALVGHGSAPANVEAQHRFGNFTKRAALTMPFVARLLSTSVNWLFSSREDTNYTYDLTAQNIMHLAHALAAVTGQPAATMAAYLAEPHNDTQLQQHISQCHDSLPPELRAVSDRTPRFARRLGWYALVRATKPKLVVETGVDKGLGGALLCAALLRNAAEGQAGRYIGTDIRTTAGYLVSGPYAQVGHIAYGDSLASLKAIDQPIDLFINDSDHSLDYEAREYQAILPRLHDGSMILSDNAHATDALADFAAQTGRKFLFFREQPEGHFYPGCGIGFAYR